MTAVVENPVHQTIARPDRLLAELEHPAQLFSHLTPNWFASIMGTGIVANAAATLPLQFRGFRTAATDLPR